MRLRLENHIGINVATQQVEALGQWRVFDDDLDARRPVGYLGHAKDAPLCLIVKATDEEVEEARRQVEQLRGEKHPTLAGVPIKRVTRLGKPEPPKVVTRESLIVNEAGDQIEIDQAEGDDDATGQADEAEDVTDDE